ncbi:MAG TPA: hypothetical protein VHB46_19570 [Burkholderiales bacterium]|nr:hypothetical protein [Burkholderiales bacterium]
MTQWEYKTFARTREFSSSGKAKDWNIDIQAKLAELGDQGWELVSYGPRCDMALYTGHPGSYGFGATTSDIWIFKRPKAS